MKEHGKLTCVYKEEKSRKDPDVLYNLIEIDLGLGIKKRVYLENVEHQIVQKHLGMIKD